MMSRARMRAWDFWRCHWSKQIHWIKAQSWLERALTIIVMGRKGLGSFVDWEVK